MKSFYANKVCSTDKVPTAARLAPEEFFSLSSTQEFVFSSLNTSNSLQHITAMSDWFYCYYFGFGGGYGAECNEVCCEGK